VIETARADEAKSSGLVDEVVAADALMDRACDVARQLARIPADNFRAAKLRLRADAIRKLDAAGDDLQTMQLWASPMTRDRIQAYLATIARK